MVTVTHISELGVRLLLADEELLLPCFVSVASFLWLAWSVGGYNPQVASVFMADIVALVTSSSVSWRMCTYNTAAKIRCSRPPSALARLNC